MTAAAPEPTSPPTTADLGSSSGGVWTRGQARACGLTDDVIDARLRLGYWQLLRPGVYCDGGITPTPVVRAWAAVLASGGPGRAWADGRTTLRLFALPLIDDDDPATGAADAEHDDVAVHRSRAPRQLETLHRHRRRRPFEVGVLHGCPSVSLEEALLSAAGVLTLEALICTLDAALHRGVLTTARLDGLIATGRRHVAALRRAADLADGRAESPAETLLRLLLRPHLPGLVPQVRVHDRSGRLVARLDLGDELLRLGVEADGRAGHEGSAMVAKDRKRDFRTEQLGWRTERGTWFEVRRRQQRLLARVLAAADRQRAARATSPG
jgi:very-short-patch-repair endonuclease